jgi:hypothetical protein
MVEHSQECLMLLVVVDLLEIYRLVLELGWYNLLA